MLLILKYQSYFTTDLIARFLNLKLYALIRTIYLHKLNTYLIYQIYPWLQYNNTISFQAEKILPFIQPLSSFFSHMLIGRKPVCEIPGLDGVWKSCHSRFLWKQQGENHILQQVGRIFISVLQTCIDLKYYLSQTIQCSSKNNI